MPKTIKKSIKKPARAKQGAAKAAKKKVALSAKGPKKSASALVWKRSRPGRPKKQSLVTIRSSLAKTKRAPRKKNIVIETFTPPPASVVSENGGEQRSTESKFELGPKHNAGEFQAHNLPFDYAKNRIILLVVDPKFAFIYWEVTNDKMHEAITSLGGDAKLTLRFRNLDQDRAWDVSIYERVGNWYLKLEHPGQGILVELGMKNGRGDFYSFATSNIMRLPRMGLAPKGPIKWMLVSPTGEKVITEVEEYTDADLELLKKIMGPYFFDLLRKGRFAGITGSSAENVFMNLEEIIPMGISS